VIGAWLRPSRLKEIPRELIGNRTLIVLGALLRFAFGFAAIALFAQLAGYSSLANLMGVTLVNGAAAGVIFYGAVHVFSSVFAFLLRIRPLRLLGMVIRNRDLLQHRFLLFAQIAAWFLWLRSVMRTGQIWDNAIVWKDEFLARPLPLPEVSITPWDLISCVFIFYAALLISRALRFVLEEDVYPRLHMKKGRPYATSTLIHYSIVLLGLILASIALGFDANRFTLLAGAFGVGIGFGLQTIVNNFISGIILLTERPVEVGDTIAMADVFGEVQRIGIRSSTVRTWQGAEVIVPNAELIANQVTNWTLSDRRRRLEIPIGAEYDTEPKIVMDMLLDVARSDERILRDPEPYVLFLGFGESALEFELRAWTDEFDSFLRVRSDLCVEISGRLKTAGIRVPFPQRELHVKQLPEGTQKSTTDEETQRAEPRALDGRGGSRDRNVG
jgi:small-conductance mechanosensitive channel